MPGPKRLLSTLLLLALAWTWPARAADVAARFSPATRVAIVNGKWQLNGAPTYRGTKAEGLLMNVRMVNATFEDRNRPEFDADANTAEFIAQIPDYVAHGARAFTLSLQGGMPGYEGAVNSAYEPDGSLRPAYLARVQRVIEACDRAGAAVILGCFYQRQDQVLRDEDAVRAAVVNTVQWITQRGFTNVLLEVANEYMHRGFDHAILRSHEGVASLLRLAKRTAPQLLVSASEKGGRGDFPPEFLEHVVPASDFLLIHLNVTPLPAVPARLAALPRTGKPVVCNEDAKQGADGASVAEICVQHGVSWGFMHEKLNQYFPFTFSGAADDPVVYGKLRALTQLPTQAAPGANNERPRLLVLTDIGGDPDDTQAMIRLMVYTNEFEIEGLVATSAGIPGQLKVPVTRPEIIREIIGAYGQVRGNLAKHAAGWPEAAELLRTVKTGNPRRGRDFIGEGHDTEGSRWIIARVDAGTSARPLNITVWGGQTDFAQALWRVKQERGATGLAQFIARLRVYDIADQDKLADWIHAEFPGLFYILSNAAPGVDRRHGTFRGMYLGGDESLTSQEWIAQNVLSRGPLGALYPTKTNTKPNPHGCLKEGDAPAWFFFLPRGGNNPADPSLPGWGGQYRKADDGWWRDLPFSKDSDPRETVSRWRPHFQADFAQRMAWCVVQ